MKTAEEIIQEKISKYNSNAPDIFKFQFSKKEMLIFVGAMEEYALQFIHPKDCYQCDGTGTVIFPSKATQQCMICKGTGKLIILPMQQNT